MHGCPGKTKIAVTDDDPPDPRPFGVMAGLVPAIPRRMRSIRPRAAPQQTTFEVRDAFRAWMPGTRPGMTCVGLHNVHYCNRNQFPGQPCAEWVKFALSLESPSTQPSSRTVCLSFAPKPP